MPSLYKLFGGSNSAVKKLLLWRQGDEDERWAEKALESLIKKLKNQTDAITCLENVLFSKNSQSPCITIPRSLDGRLQILHRKGLPHVIYCRIFRWPDLQSQHEIRSLDHCQFSFSKSLSEVCINPYHYERIEASVPPPVLIPRTSEYCQNKAFNGLNNIGFQSQFINGINNTVPYSNTTNLGHIYIPENNSSSVYAAVPFVDDKNWCIISYFELMNQIGEIFKANTQAIIVDGYANPITTTGRFSLGALSNVRRTPESDAVLGHIGGGIQLFYNSGDVFVENVSSSSIFIQSVNLNCVKGFHSRAVVRVSTGTSIQVFYASEFAQILANKISFGYQSVNELTKQCDIYISFIKGWGTGYSRQDLTMCPCWLSMRLCTPLSWVDRVLSSIGSPKDPISSYT
ncbi:hypothetical protein HZS_1752 [Henneguya salminicola]|uniref:Mothers against decapentaplegic homolog n=1 Tax=Henneguya salminicola TaxID=69463 RepID=A0A6G3MFA5_HENSL|nr:hypothetical protein HZS_1752 [Henneguya salminicola]